jgi:hypothetical protein
VSKSGAVTTSGDTLAFLLTPQHHFDCNAIRRSGYHRGNQESIVLTSAGRVLILDGVMVIGTGFGAARALNLDKRSPDVCFTPKATEFRVATRRANSRPTFERGKQTETPLSPLSFGASGGAIP